MPGDGALQMASAVSKVGSFAEEEGPCFRHDVKHEWQVAGIQDLLLDQSELDIQNFSKLFELELVKDDDAVEPVHEFGRKLAPRSFYCRTFEFDVEPVRRFGGRLHKTHSPADQRRDFARAQV